MLVTSATAKDGDIKNALGYGSYYTNKRPLCLLNRTPQFLFYRNKPQGCPISPKVCQIYPFDSTNRSESRIFRPKGTTAGSEVRIFKSEIPIVESKIAPLGSEISTSGSNGSPWGLQFGVYILEIMERRIPYNGNA